MKLKTKRIIPPTVGSDLDFSDFSQLKTLILKVAHNSFHRIVILEQLKVPSTLTSLSLVGIRIRNLEEVLSGLNLLKTAEITLE